MADNTDKMNELRAQALEMELRKPKHDTGMDAELEYHADVLAHDDRPGTSVAKSSGNGIKIFIAIMIVCAAIGIASYFMLHSSDENDNVCRTQCNDGTCSPSEGPGTCSYHGGIKKPE